MLSRSINLCTASQWRLQWNLKMSRDRCTWLCPNRGIWTECTLSKILRNRELNVCLNHLVKRVNNCETNIIHRCSEAFNVIILHNLSVNSQNFHVKKYNYSDVSIGDRRKKCAISRFIRTDPSRTLTKTHIIVHLQL